jgi:hypothetical protein
VFHLVKDGLASGQDSAGIASALSPFSSSACLQTQEKGLSTSAFCGARRQLHQESPASREAGESAKRNRLSHHGFSYFRETRLELVDSHSRRPQFPHYDPAGAIGQLGRFER